MRKLPSAKVPHLTQLIEIIKYHTGNEGILTNVKSGVRIAIP